MFRSILNTYRHWAFACLVVTLSAIIALFGETGRELFAYKSDLFRNGEFWRSVSGHFTHLGWPHFLLNAFGLLGVWSLYGKTFNAALWAVIFLTCSIGISFGFTIFDNDIQNYVGLSGILHGAVAAGAVYSILATKADKANFPVESLFVCAALWLKIVYEQLIGSVPLTSEMSGGAVVINAHFYGGVLGVSVGGGIGLFTRMRNKKAQFTNYG